MVPNDKIFTLLRKFVHCTAYLQAVDGKNGLHIWKMVRIRTVGEGQPTKEY